MKLLIACLFSSWLLTGCVVSLDPLGMTERTQIRADASTAQEHERSLALMAEAQAKVDQEAAKQAGANHRAATWAMILPVLAIIAGAAVLGFRLIDWRGRIHLERMRLGAAQPTQYQQWRAIAMQHQAELKIINNRPVLILPNGRKMLVEKANR